jgi:ABC-type transport system involved in multi-copper enzyme maturation permease subunit
MTIVGPVSTIAWHSFRGSLRGMRTASLALFAAIPSLIVVALAAGHTDPESVAQQSQQLFLDLTLPVVVIVVMLILAVAQFRTEIDDDTLSYLSSRSIPRWGIVLGKYLGCVGAALLILVPAALGPEAVAFLTHAPPPPTGVLEAIVAMTVLASLAYGALFLALGLLTPWALLYGLILGFLWEQLLQLLPGSIPKVTISFYLHSLGSNLVATGPFAHFPMTEPTAYSVAGPVLAAAVFVGTAMAAIRYVELVPERTSA